MLQSPGTSLLLRMTRLPCVLPSRGRKSRNDPPAKSKASRIKYPPLVCVDELLNINRRYREYSSILTAIRAEFKEEILRAQYEEQVGSLAEQRHRLEREEHEALMTWNKEENCKALHRRLERLRQTEDELRLHQKLIAERRVLEEQEFVQKREQEIERLQEEAKSFITLDNLSERIEAALDNPKSYNFCLDREGRIIRQCRGQT
ncbi:small ribosomal subunit protein mS26-like [Rhinophrynus dorsalis]